MSDPRAEIPRLDEIATGFMRSQVLFTALRAGVFDHLRAPRQAHEVAGANGWDERGTRILLDGLVALDLVTKTGAEYRNAPAAEACLVEGASADQRHIILHRAGSYADYARLEEAVRAGTGLQRAMPQRSPEELRHFICGMADIARHSAAAILERLDLSPYTNMLDAGGGPGSYSIAFCQKHPALRATVFDRPEVLDIAREQVHAAELDDRFAFIGGDLTTDPLGTGYDLILVSNIIHSFGERENRDLVRSCHEALVDGGLLIIKDFLIDPERTGPPFGLMFAVHMLLHTEAGDTYTVDDAARWTSEAGFRDGQLLDLTPQSRLWMARR